MEKPPPQGSELKALVEKAQSGDLAARNELVTRNLGLIMGPTKYYARRNPGIDLDDLLQVARIGLIRSIKGYDYESKYKFSTYATFWIKHELRKLVRDVHAKGVSSSTKDTSEYIEGRMDPEKEKLYEAACHSYLSLDETAISGERFGGHHELMRDVIEDPASCDAYENSVIGVLHRQVQSAFESGAVSRPGIFVLTHHFGLDGNQALPLKRVAAKMRQMGTPATPEDVQAILENALRDLRDYLGEN